MEVLYAFVVGMVAFICFWAVGLGGLVSLLILIAILLVGVTAYTYKDLLRRDG